MNCTRPHRSLHAISWDEFGALTRTLARTVREAYNPDCIVGIATGGDIVGATLAALLRLDYLPMKLSRREQGQVVRATPRLWVRPSPAVEGRRVLLADDVAVTGDTLARARRLVRRRGPDEIRTAALVRRAEGITVDFCALACQSPIAFPWDSEAPEDP